MATLSPDFSNKFINPYNFISQTTQTAREPLRKGALTGSVSCRVVVRNELALPDHEDGKDNSFPFFQINGNPLIPGSEIRGCIRSAYEAITPSCFSVVNSDILTKRLPRPDNAVCPGILKYKNGKWYIYAAEKQKETNWNRIDFAIKRKWPAFKGGDIKTALYVQTGTEPVYTCSRKEIDDYLELIGVYQSYQTEKTKSLFLNILKSIEQYQSLVVFYRIEDNKLTYFSPAQISRYRFHSTVSSLLGNHAPGGCGKNGEYCPACALFGTLGNNSPIASRLRFGDASAEHVKLCGGYRNLPELSTPKTTTIEFYSHKNDKYRDTAQWGYDDAGVSLNGRKFYYHSTPKAESKLGPRSVAVKTALAGSTFRFDVFFDRISEEQLRQLLWVLTIGDNKEASSFCHKLGMGKSVGYGSIKIVVDDVVLRTYSTGSYVVEHRSFDDLSVSDALFPERNALSEFKLIANYGYVGSKRVVYPIADDGQGKQNSTAAHQWFTSNRTQAKQFRFVLHPLTENTDELELPAMTASKEPGTRSGTGRQSKERTFQPRAERPARQPYPSGVTLTEGTTYQAEITGEFSDRFENTYYLISIDRITEINGKKFKIKKQYASGKNVGDLISVRFNGFNEKGVAMFWVNR